MGVFPRIVKSARLELRLFGGRQKMFLNITRGNEVFITDGIELLLHFKDLFHVTQREVDDGFDVNEFEQALPPAWIDRANLMERGSRQTRNELGFHVSQC